MPTGGKAMLLVKNFEIERKKKERMFIYHLHTLNSIVSTAST
jgi:hypothetical protein